MHRCRPRRVGLNGSVVPHALQVGDASTRLTIDAVSDSIAGVLAPFTVAVERDGADVGERVVIALTSGPGTLSGSQSHIFATTSGSFVAADLALDSAGQHLLSISLTKVDSMTVSVTHTVVVRLDSLPFCYFVPGKCTHYHGTTWP